MPDDWPQPDYHGVLPLFCRRNRALNPGESPYEVVVESLSLGADSSSFDVLNQENGVLFNVELTPVRDNTARIRMREKSPMRPRYEVEGALVDEPEKERYVATAFAVVTWWGVACCVHGCSHVTVSTYCSLLTVLSRGNNTL